MGPWSDTWNAAGTAARVILVVLVAFAGLLFSVAVERYYAYRRAGGSSGRSAHGLRSELHRRMHLLSAIKVTAPLLGFLGTLMGAINVLAGIASRGVIDPHQLAAGMAEALMLTVLGLVVGLPAWWVHGFFVSWSERILAHAD